MSLCGAGEAERMEGIEGIEGMEGIDGVEGIEGRLCGDRSIAIDGMW